MRPTQGTYISALDHLRGFAALLVIAWHVAHTSPQCKAICFEHQLPQSWPWLAWIEQGHTGVSLFLVLSGYVFAHLTFEKRVRLLPFWGNRLLRLMPLLLFWVLLNALLIWHQSVGGTPFRTLFAKPPGSWTIFLELEYYAMLPILVWALGRFGAGWIAVAIAALLAFRWNVWTTQGSVQHAAYWTLAGRMDQFLLGSAALYAQRRWIGELGRAKSFALGGCALSALWLFFEAFGKSGGLWPADNSPSMWWVFLPTIEGLCYAALIVAYCGVPASGYVGTGLSALGRWSYSMYLNHFLIVGTALPLLNARWPFPQGLLPRLVYGALLLMPLVVAASALTYRCIERPWLSLRRPYVKDPDPLRA